MGNKAGCIKGILQEKTLFHLSMNLRIYSWIKTISLIHYLYFTPDFEINQILEAVKKEENGK